MNRQPRNQGERDDIARSLLRIRKLRRDEDRCEIDGERLISDLLADIRHYCHSAGIDYYECADRAYNYYRDERNLPTLNLEREAA